MIHKNKLPAINTRYFTKSGFRLLFIKYKFKSWLLLRRFDFKLGKIWGDGKAFAGRFVPLFPNFHHEKRLTNNPGGVAIIGVLAVLLFSILAPFLQTPVYALNNELVPNADYGTMNWLATSNAEASCSSGSHCPEIAEGSSHNTSGYIYIDNSTASVTDEFDLATFTNVASATSITVSIYAQSTTNANGGQLDDVQIDLYIGGSYQGTKNLTPAYNSWGKLTTTAYTGSWSQTDLDSARIQVTRVVQGSGNPTNQRDTVQVASVYADVEYTSTASTTQTHFRWRDDAYTVDVDNGWLATEDSNSIGDIDHETDMRLRFEIDRTGASVTDAYRLEWTDKGTGSCSSGDESWERMDTASDAFALIDATNLTNGTTIATSRLTGDNTTYVSGESVDSGSSGDDTADNITLATDEFTEVEYAFEPTTSATSGSTYCFRVSDSGTALDLYSVYPEMTITPPPPNPHLTQEGYVFESDDRKVRLDEINQAAIKIDDTSDFGDLPGWGHQIITLTSGELIAALNDGGSCEIWEYNSTTNTWTEADSSNNPTCASGEDVSIAANGNDEAYMAYVSTSNQIRVVLYDGTFSTDEVAISATYNTYHPSIAVDSSEEPHVVAHEFDFGQLQSNILYTNKISGSWKTPVVVQTDQQAIEKTDIIINEDDIPELHYTSSLAVGNLNNATSFTTHSISMTTGGDIAVDSLGNTWYSAVNSGNMKLYKHNDGDSWTTWGAAIDSGNAAGGKTTIAIVNDYIYVIYEDDENDISYDRYKDEWLGETKLATGTYQKPTARWAYNWNDDWQGASTNAIDFMYSDGTDVYWATLNPENETPQSVAAGSKFTTGKTLSGVRQGENITLRTQLTNTGNSVVADDELALFYDRNDGMWSKVEQQQVLDNSAGSGCTGGSADWTCTVIDATDNVGNSPSIAYDAAGNPWIASYDATNSALVVAQYVGTGGTGCGGGSSAWTCTAVDVTDTIGEDPSIAFDSSGTPWVAYFANTGSDLMLAEFVGGTSGTGCDGGSSAWSCTLVDNGTTGRYPSLAFNSSDEPWIISVGASITDSVRVAEYVGSGGSCNDTEWDCYNLATSSDLEYRTSLVIDANDTAWASYILGGDIKVAEYVGGTSGTGCSSSAWDGCSTVDSGDDAFMAIDPSGALWISFYDVASSVNNLVIAEYVGGAGGTGCTSSDWNCTTVDATDNVGNESSLAFSPGGSPWISYQDGSNTSLELAMYVGSGGNCDTVGAGSDAWECTTIINASSDGFESSLAFDARGNPAIAHYESTGDDLEFATLDIHGEILIAPSVTAVAGDSLTESHADMTSSTDTTNRDDADCISAGASWNDGTYMESENGTGLVLAAGDGTAQCTELAWTLDTSQATPGETYRFVVATKDAARPDISPWRGPISVATDAYPTLTISDADESTYRYSKDTIYQGTASIESEGPTSAGAGSGIWTNPSYITADDTNSASINIDAQKNSTPLTASSFGFSVPTDATIKGIEVKAEKRASDIGLVSDASARIVKGGTVTGDQKAIATFWSSSVDIVTTYGSSTDLWGATWTAADINASNFGFAISATNNDTIGSRTAFVQHIEITVYYTAGSDCTDTDWTCTIVFDGLSDTDGAYNQMAFDQSGTAWASFSRNVNTADDLVIAKYVGDGTGAGCGGAGSSTYWDCETIFDGADDTDGKYNVLGISPTDGTPWVAFHNDEAAGDELMVANYVGSGGNCDTLDNLGSDAWQCTTVYTGTEGLEGATPSIAFDKQGNPWVTSFNEEGTADELVVSHYVGSGGNCDTFDGAGGSDAWQCDVLYNGGGEGSDAQWTSIAFNSAGIPWVSFKNDEAAGDDLVVANYIGSGGNCDGFDGTGGSDAWQCTTVFDGADDSDGIYNSIAIDSADKVYVSFMNNDTTGDHLIVAEYVGGTGGNCNTFDTGTLASTAWNCTKVFDGANDLDGATSSIAIDSAGDPWVAFHNNETTGDQLIVANYVGSGGDCDDTAQYDAGGSDAWECHTLQTGIAGADYQWTSIAFDSSGAPWVSAKVDDALGDDLLVAKLKLPDVTPTREVVNSYNGRNAGSSDLRYMLSSGLAPYTDSYGNCGGNSNLLGYCGAYHPDGQLDSMTAAINESPMYSFSTRYDNNSTAPAARVYFRSDTSPASQNVVVQVYRYGTTNDWETVSTYNSAGCSTATCVIVAQPTGTTSEYFETDGSYYWMHYRMYQESSSSASTTLYIDSFTASQTVNQLRHGAVFRDQAWDPFRW